MANVSAIPYRFKVTRTRLNRGDLVSFHDSEDSARAVYRQAEHARRSGKYVSVTIERLESK